MELCQLEEHHLLVQGGMCTYNISVALLVLIYFDVTYIIFVLYFTILFR